MSKDEQIIIIDGYSFVFRAYYAMPPLTRPDDGLPVGAVYGFTSMLMKLISGMKPTHLVIVFDAGKKTYRNEIYPEYKAHRPPPPEDLIPQFPLMREVADAFNIKVLEKVGFEADDVIATLVHMAKENKEKILIVSSDKDLMQLVNHEVKMYDAIKMKLIGEKEVKDKFGVLPTQMRDLLALVGDSSDNVPGLPGIGPKTASELLNKYNNIEGILEHSSEIKQPKRRATIEAGKDIIDLSSKLVSLRDDLKIDIKLQDLKTQEIESSKLLKFLNKQGFKSLIARVKKEFNVKEVDLQETQEAAVSYSKISKEKHATNYVKKTSKTGRCEVKILSSIDDLEAIYEEAIISGKIAIYLQNSFEHTLEIKTVEDVYAIGIAYNNDLVHVLKFTEQTSFEKVRGFIVRLLDDIAITKIFYDYKLLLHLINSSVRDNYNDGVDDIMLMSYSLGGGRDIFSLEKLLEFYLEQSDEVFSNVGGVTKCKARLSELGEEKFTNYMARKTQNMFYVHEKLAGFLFKNSKQALYQKFDNPLSVIVYNMESKGLRIDEKKFKELSDLFDKQLKKISLEIYKIAGQEFNIASTKQLSEILFHKMKLGAGKRSAKSGDYRTDFEILEQLQANGHTIADFIIEWRQIAKLKSTYTDALLKQLSENNDRIHTTFSLAYTSTGRFSSINPNLQNIPIRGEYGERIRAAFIAKPGYKILSADYSQIELRILATIAKVEALQEAFNKGNCDIHAITASEVFSVSLDKVTSELRRKAKIINFGITYGVGEYGLAKRLGVSRIEASHYIKRYFQKYPEVLKYMESCKKFVHKYGYVETLMGRRCYIKYGSSEKGRLFAERAAINAPIQGTNADIIRKAMVVIHDQILCKSKNVYMISQIHDELLFEIKDDDHLKATVEKIQQLMTTSIMLSIPMKVDCKLGLSWGKV
ncbi:MAG: DNA polymerase I [Rickettsiales bacterium]|nr:DNA polymerase I [Rickettsiales bacterium]